MNIAFCLFNYFPYWGLQRDFFRIASACQALGHTAHVYTMAWEGPMLDGATVHMIDARGWQHHTQIHSFIQQVKKHLDKTKPDLVVGFNKMPFLDVYYAADVCYQDRIEKRGRVLDRWLPRYKQFVANEQAVFARGQATQILLIAPQQQQIYTRYYGTENERFHLLPPGISRDRMAPPEAAEIRASVRQALSVKNDEYMLLMVGSGFRTKGLDRAIRGMAFLPGMLKSSAKLFVLGQDNPKPFQALATTLHINDQVRFLGGRDNVRDFMLAADVLVHPAYHENTGTVLLEAVVAGLPVLTVDACGYAGYIRDARAGIVLKEPFNQSDFNTSLQRMLLDLNNIDWRDNALSFAKSADIYSMPQRAAEMIEQVGQRRVLA